MATLYALSPRKRKRFPYRKLGKKILLFVLLILLPLYVIYNVQLYPGIAKLATAAAGNRIESLISAAISQCFSAEDVGYDDLVRITYRSDGGVASLSCQMAKLNHARNTLLVAVLEGLRDEKGVEVSLPLGNLLGGEAFSARGPEISVRILLAPGARAYMESEFRSAGINQTLHRVLFTVTVNLTVLMPSHPEQLTVTQSFCVAETLIVGEVPDAFTQVNRLTDDVTEIELDDINDYGASV